MVHRRLGPWPLRADSLAAIRQRVLREHRFTYAQLLHYLDTNWEGPEGERARLFLQNVDRYGKGGSDADDLAVRPFPDLHAGGQGAAHARARLPDGSRPVLLGEHADHGRDARRHPQRPPRGEPISHGANPNPGFRKDGAATAMSAAIASVQPGYGNTAPMQIELEPSVTTEEEGIELVMALIEDHFAQGGTLINLNVIDAERVRAAHEDPSLYPDLVVRVTGFSAYFASLSPKFRQLVVDRILDKQVS